MSVQPALRVDGVWLGASGHPYADLSWTDRADGGNFEASWSMALEFGSRPGSLYKGAVVEIMLGAQRRWYGLLNVLDWNAGTFTATGLAAFADTFSTVTSPTTSTSTPDDAIDGAISRGWLVTRPTTFWSSPITATPTTANYVAPLLDQVSLNLGQRWGVWADGVVRRYSAPTLPTLYLAPGALELGESGEDVFSLLILEFTDLATSATGYLARAAGPGPAKEHVESVTNLGPMSVATAGSIADAAVALGSLSRGWVSSIEVSSSQLTRPSGLPADLATVSAGELMRALVPGPAGLQYVDLLVGETKYVAGADSISLSPTEKVASSLSEVIEDTYARVTGTPVAA